MKLSFFSAILSLLLFSGNVNEGRASSRKCGPSFTVNNLDNNNSDIYLIQFRNVETGVIVCEWYGENVPMSGYFGIGTFDVTVYTDSQGLVRCQAPGLNECIDAYSSTGDSRAYLFARVNLECCICGITISIDDVECP